MTISLLNAGKRFNREWIFRHLNYDFFQGTHYAITGANGSGKSTLLQVIAGATLHSEGEVRYEGGQGSMGNKPHAATNESLNDISKTVSVHNESGTREQKIVEPYKFLSFAAPYLELVEEMTATEFLVFHSKFKHLVSGIKDILYESGLSRSSDKQIRYFSSGMKQRLKLAQAFYSDTPVLLLDEPLTNLDAEGIVLYHSLIKNHGTKRLVIISSNDEKEYDFCSEVIRIGDYK
ncbi:MAG: ATP-binding cassette domain-containing protein [Ferruginibacter sp.]